jgi:hypothetical protein
LGKVQLSCRKRDLRRLRAFFEIATVAWRRRVKLIARGGNYRANGANPTNVRGGTGENTKKPLFHFTPATLC